MHIALIAGGVFTALILIWLLIRTNGSEPVQTTRTVLSSDTYTKIVLTIIATSTTINTLQGFLN